MAPTCEPVPQDLRQHRQADVTYPSISPGTHAHTHTHMHTHTYMRLLSEQDTHAWRTSASAVSTHCPQPRSHNVRHRSWMSIDMTTCCCVYQWSHTRTRAHTVNPHKQIGSSQLMETTQQYIRLNLDFPGVEVRQVSVEPNRVTYSRMHDGRRWRR